MASGAVPEKGKPREEIASHKSALQKTLAIPTSLSQVDQLIKEKPMAVQATSPKAKEVPEVLERDEAREAFDESKLQDALDGIIHEFKLQEKNMEVSMLRQPFALREEKIVFFLNGEIQKDIFFKIRPEITGLIRKALQNNKVDLSFEIKEEAVDPSKKLYTSTDKLRYLREKSPALKELQKRFGLETDF